MSVPTDDDGHVTLVLLLEVLLHQFGRPPEEGKAAGQHPLVTQREQFGNHLGLGLLNGSDRVTVNRDKGTQFFTGNLLLVLLTGLLKLGLTLVNFDSF